MLEDQPFTYKEMKSGKIFIYYNGKQIMILSEKNSKKILRKLHGANEEQEQLILAKVTGNFKHGNERVVNK